jgi:hypothetical protein
MSFFPWLRNRTSIRSPRARAQHRPAARRFRPHLEALEDRCVPSTLKVTNLLDSGKGSLRYEIAQAQSNDTIVFAKHLDGGTITLGDGDQLYINKNLTIQGPGAGLLTIRSGHYANTTRIFEVGYPGKLTLSGLTISNGGGKASVYASDYYDGDGGAILDLGTLTISDCIVNYSTAQNGLGGGIANFGTLTVSGCTLSNDSTSYGYGGGIYNYGTLTVSGCTLSGDTAGYGGGIYNDFGIGALTVSGSTLSGNSAAYNGGGIFNNGAATVSGCTLSGNSAPWGGGGILNNGTLTVSNSMFSSNSPDNIFGSYTDGGGNTFK